MKTFLDIIETNPQLFFRLCNSAFLIVVYTNPINWYPVLGFSILKTKAQVLIVKNGSVIMPPTELSLWIIAAMQIKFTLTDYVN